MLPPGSSLSDLDHDTCDFGPGSEFIKVLIISFIILLLGTARLHTLMEYLNTSMINDSCKVFNLLISILCPTSSPYFPRIDLCS